MTAPRLVGGWRLGVGIGALIGASALIEALLLARGSKLAFLLLGALAIAVGTLVIVNHLFEAFVVWIAIEGLAFPFVRYPLHHDVATFDRYSVVVMGGALLLNSWPAMSKRSRQLTGAFALFALVYVARALLTDPLPLAPHQPAYSSLQPLADALDNVGLPFIVFLVAARTVTPIRWPSVARALTFLGTTLALVALAQWATGFELATITGATPFVDPAAGLVRAAGPYPDPVIYGGVMLVCLAGTLYWILTEKAYTAGVAILGLEILSLAPGYTKTVWAAAFATVVLGLGLRSRVSSRTVLVFVYAAVAVGLAYTTVQNSTVVESRVTGQIAQDNWSGREATWHEAISIFKRWPIAGAGNNQFIAAQALVPQVRVKGVEAATSPHNVFLGVLAEIGAAGLLCLLILVAAIVMIVRTCRKWATTDEEIIFGSVLLAATVGYFLLSQTFGMMYARPSSMFLALMVGAAAARVDHTARTRGARAPRPFEA
jgi:O-antigen ligase